MSNNSADEMESKDEEKELLSEESHDSQIKDAATMNVKLWLSIGVNVLATVAIVFTNKRIFETPALRHAQVAFAAFHFIVTFGLLYVLSRPGINMFRAKRVKPVQIMPLALGMIGNVVLTNTSLAYSSIQFYQVSRVFLTPTVALLNYMISRTTIPSPAAVTLVPVCLGVGVVSYFDTKPTTGSKAAATSPIGVVFAFAGVFASSIYTVWIKKYHDVLQCSSMQLLMNQAPVSVLLMLYIIPFSDDVMAWRAISGPLWLLIGLSGIMACLITMTQFIIVNEAGPVSSTVVGHFKTCLIVTLGWIHSRKPFRDGSLIGIVLALGGITSYSVVMHRLSRE